MLGRSFVSALSGVGLTCMAGPAASAPSRSADSALAQCVAAQAEAVDFSGVVSIARRTGTTTYARGRLGGPGSPEITPDTRFNIASAGKMFTAVAVAQLIDSGKIALDDLIGRFVGGLTPEAGAVTVRQLLNHSSGLGNFFSIENLPAIQSARTVSDLIPLVAADKPAFVPGSRFQYSNTGFLLLGRLIERVSGESYNQYLKDHIFKPAGMTTSGLDAGPHSIQASGLTSMPEPSPGMLLKMRPAEPHGSGGFAPTPGPLRLASEAAMRGSPAGGSYSTATDMHRFFSALSGGRLVNPSTFVALTSRQIVAGPGKAGAPDLTYGLGFGVGVFQGHRWFGHNGGAPGANVEATAYPDDGTELVVMANRDPPVATTLFRQLRTVLFSPESLRDCSKGKPLSD